MMPLEHLAEAMQEKKTRQGEVPGVEGVGGTLSAGDKQGQVKSWGLSMG